MTKSFDGKRLRVWADSETTGTAHLQVAFTDTTRSSGDATCYVTCGFWMGVDAAKELRGLLTEAIFAVEEEQATRGQVAGHAGETNKE